MYNVVICGNSSEILWPRGRCRADVQTGSAQDRDGRGSWRDALAGQGAHPSLYQVCHLQKRWSEQFQTFPRVQHLPPVHVSLEKIQIFAVLQFIPWWAGGVQAHLDEGVHFQLAHHAAARAAVLLFSGTPATRLVGCCIRTTRHNLAAGHLLPCCCIFR